MGTTNSTTTQCTNNSTMPTNCLCCVPRPRFKFRFPNMWQKLHRSLSRRLNFQARKRGSIHTSRRALLRPMPRCSSFGSSGTLMKATKSATPLDNHYAQWKCMFEHAKQKQQKQKHDISGALSGQTTPRGFPSHTDPRRCVPVPEEEDLVKDLVGNIKIRRRLSFRLPKLAAQSAGSVVRRPNARERAAQAKIDEQLQRDLYDLEDYYGGFHYAQRNERLVHI